MLETAPLVANTKPTRKRRPKTGVAKGMRVRIFPTPEQEDVLFRWTGACRWVWNWALGAQQHHYRQTEKHLSTNTLSKTLTGMLTTGVEPVEHKDVSWLRDLPRTSLTCTLNALKESWTAFFDGCSGKRADKPGMPTFKKFRKAK